MATYEIISWRGVPAIVEARDEQGPVTRSLSDRFQMLIDTAAMQLGLQGSEEYLEQWNRSTALERPGSAAQVAEAVAADLEERFPEYIGQAFRSS
ncbi:MAG: virulence factor [Candidatus Rokuibacteriota bacterium]